MPGLIAILGFMGWFLLSSLRHPDLVPGLPQQMLRGLEGLGIGRLHRQMVVVMVYPVPGMGFDRPSMMIKALSIIVPLLVAARYDPVWLGVVITRLIGIGMLTPPVEMNIFVASGMTQGTVSQGQGACAAFPCRRVLPGLMALVTALPGLMTWLPGPKPLQPKSAGAIWPRRWPTGACRVRGWGWKWRPFPPPTGLPCPPHGWSMPPTSGPG